jgi:hypothetical protein
LSAPSPPPVNTTTNQPLVYKPQAQLPDLLLNEKKIQNVQIPPQKKMMMSRKEQFY